MARHRSPQGRRAHLGLPLPLTPAAAGAGGATITLPARPTRLIAWAVAGSALAAAGQMAVTEALPVAADGVDVLRVGVAGLLSPATAAAQATVAATPVVTEPLAAVTPVAAAPAVVGADELVKASDLYAAAAAEAVRAAEEARLAAEARAAEEARLAEEAASAATGTTAVAASGGGVQMVVGSVTSGFGARWGTSHQGLDIAAPIGTPIRVPLDGTVIDSGPASGFGQWVRVRHDDGTVTVYGHISESHVSVGDSVSAGDVIAEVGNEGRSTGPHLHFEVVVDGTKVNPRPWLDERGIGLT